MCSILVDTTDFYKFAEELANDFNLNDDIREAYQRSVKRHGTGNK